MDYDNLRKDIYERYHAAFQVLYISELKDEIHDLREELARKDQQIADLKKELKALSDEWTNQENEMIDLEEEVSRLTKKLAENEKPAKKQRKWKCPINYPNCTKNCGDYGCGN